MDDAAMPSASNATQSNDAARGNEPVAVFPYLVFKEFLAALLISVGLLLWALAVNAPLLPEANPGRTENPAKAPWYFVGLQELLVYFDPWIAGVAIPTLIIVGLMAIPYLDTSRTATGRYTFTVRRLAISHFLLGFALWWVLIAIGQFLRGPNWQFYWPWQDWSLTQSAEESLWSFPWWLGLPALVAYFAAGLLLPRWRWPWLYAVLGRARYVTVITLTLLMYGVPIKIVLRLLLHVKYVLVTPWFNV
jgi:cytochrome b/b6/petD-like protein